MVSDEGADPTPDWKNRVPSLDNGQLIWALIALENVLLHHMKNAKEGPLLDKSIQLAQRIHTKIEFVRKTVMVMFYEQKGRVRCIATIKDVNGSPLNRSNYTRVGKGILDDSYEGEMMHVFMDLLGDWEFLKYDLSERDKLWQVKSYKLKKVLYPSKLYGNIPVEEGYWYSSHEKWKYLILPFKDSSINWRVFLNGERVRLINSIENSIPGLLASVTKPTTFNRYTPKYASECGIPAISKQGIIYTNIVTPYASFPTILANLNVGLSWYLNMIKGSRMQGIFGTTESIDIDGKKICPVLTWDSKITTLVAMCGGVVPYTSNYMKEYGLYERFIEIINREWSRVFGDGSLNGEEISFESLMPNPIPKGIREFTVPAEYHIVKENDCAVSNGKKRKID